MDSWAHDHDPDFRGRTAARQSRLEGIAASRSRDRFPKDALARLAGGRRRADSLCAGAEAASGGGARAAAQDKIALGAAQQRYQEGLVDFLNVNAALAQLLRSENDLVQSDVEVASDLVRLYRALGGGWEIAE
jgi:hypothetical protein